MKKYCYKPQLSRLVCYIVGGKESTIAILKSMQEKVHSSVSSGDVFCAKIDEGHKSIFDIGFFTKK